MDPTPNDTPSREREIAMPLDITLLTRPGCPHCERAKGLLDERGWLYEEIALGGDLTMDSVRAISGRSTVPQIYMDGDHIGGADDLAQWLAR